MYGTREQLSGWDSSVEVFSDQLETNAESNLNSTKVVVTPEVCTQQAKNFEQKGQWIFSVKDCKYKNISDPLTYDNRALLMSAGSRIWRVLEVRSTDKLCRVLKDHHPWAVSRKESEVLADIFDCLGPEHQQDARPRFLSFAHDESLALTKDLPPNYEHQPWSLLARYHMQGSQYSIYESAQYTHDIYEASIKPRDSVKFSLRQH
jgi:hypothetical protein